MYRIDADGMKSYWPIYYLEKPIVLSAKGFFYFERSEKQSSASKTSRFLISDFKGFFMI